MDDGFAPIPGSVLQPSLPRFHSLWLLVGFGPWEALAGTGRTGGERSRSGFLASSLLQCRSLAVPASLLSNAAALRGVLGGTRALRLRLVLSSAWKVLNRTIFVVVFFLGFHLFFYL